MMQVIILQFSFNSVARERGRKHTAWGASPRIDSKKAREPARAGDSAKHLGLSPVSRARRKFCFAILGLAPQALCFRPHRGLNLYHCQRNDDSLIIKM
jgi:hypothetical protein